VKGRQRPFVFVLGFDSSYIGMIRKREMDKCPNTMYVACTRASKEMYLFETEKNDNRPLSFLQMNHREMMSQEFVDFIGIPRGPMWYISRDSFQQQQQKQQSTPPVTIPKRVIKPSKLIEFLNHEVIEKVMPTVNRVFKLLTPPQEKSEINIPTMVQTGTNRYEDVCDINNIAIPCMFFNTLSTYEPTTLYTITKKMLDNTYESQYVFLKTQVEERMPRICKTTSDYLLSANMYAAVREKLYNKLTQIQEYNWVDEEDKDACIKRMQKWISKDDTIEVEKEIISTEEEEKQVRIREALKEWTMQHHQDVEMQMMARVDALTTTTLWELKFAAELTVEHFLQLMIYAWIWRTIYPNVPKSFRLFNIRTNEVYELEAEQQELKEVIITLLQSKYGEEDTETEYAFVEKCRKIWNPTKTP
jgi:hypothetical protein